MRELLDEDGMRQLKLHDSSLNSYVGRLAGGLYFTDTPLTTEQGRNMARVFAETATKVARGQTTATEYWDIIEPQARAFLSEPQLAVLAGLRSRDEWLWAQDQALKKTKNTP